MRLGYSITRPFKWRWFTPISLAGAVIAITFLIVVNVALTGYETITVFNSNFNITQSHWFDRFMPFREAKLGTLCDSHVFNVGDPITTNYSFFQWTVDSILLPNAGTSGISYNGIPLTFCDVDSVYFDASLLSWSIDFTVVSACVDTNQFNVTARTSFTLSSLPGRYSPLLGVIRTLPDGTKDVRGYILNNLLLTASQDLGIRAQNALTFSNNSSPIVLSAQVGFKYCPMSSGLNASCAINPPRFDIIAAASVYPNTTLLAYTNESPIDPISNPWVFDNDTQLAIYNLVQTVYAAIRIDLGNPSSNNFILNPAALNDTIAATFPLTQANGELTSASNLYSVWSTPFPWLKQHLPVTVPGPATIQVVYACQFQQPKSFGSMFISVLVATLSMFSSGWAVYMVMATAVARRINSTANWCDGHSFRHALDLDPSWIDTSETYALQNHKGSGVVYRPAQSQSFSLSKDLPHTLDTEIDSTSEFLLNVNASPDS